MRRAVSRLLPLVMFLASGCREEPAVDEAAIADARPSLEYAAQIATTPERPRAGQETSVALRITAPFESVPQLESVAGSPVHLVAVSRDLTWYEHRHPRLAGDTYAATLTFPADGQYVLHAIVWPRGRSQLVQTTIVKVGDPAGEATPRPLLISSREATVGKYGIRLRSNPEPPSTGSWSSLTFEISRSGRPVTNLTPTGTLGHMVILREGGEDFVYAHSTDGEALSGVRARAHQPAVPLSLDDTHRRHTGDTGPDVTFHTQFPHAGTYKVWVEFLAGEDSIKAGFVVDVGGPKPQPEHEH